MPATPALILLGALAATLGALGGLGGAVFLVPALVVLGVEPQVAAPLGIVSVGASSLAAAPSQLERGLANHRLGVTLEIPASAGAIAGALVAEAVSATALTVLLAGVAVVAAVSGLRRRGLRNPPQAVFSEELAGEWPGALAGAYHLDGGVVPYQARRVPLGLVAMLAAGTVSGLAGVGGGFIKTPAMSEIMRIPVKVAAATTTFTVGITAGTSLLVFGLQDRIVWFSVPPIVVGSLAGGMAGAAIQARVHPQRVRAVLSVALLGVAAILVATA
jgi:uncharacterized membrane protein YfcA